MKRDAPFEPADGDFDKYIQELIKNSSHIAAINKKVAEQKLNGGNINIKEPAQSLDIIRQQHQKTINELNHNAKELSFQMKHGSCAHEVFKNNATFNHNGPNYNYQNSQILNNTQNYPNTFNKVNTKDALKITKPMSTVASYSRTNSSSKPLSNNKNKAPNPVFILFGFFTLFIFLINGLPTEGIIFFSIVIFMNIIRVIVANKKK